MPSDFFIMKEKLLNGKHNMISDTGRGVKHLVTLNVMEQLSHPSLSQLISLPSLPSWTT
jgi:hypothetical protein